MSNDTGSTNQGSGKDPTAGTGQPRSEGESIAPDTAASSGDAGAEDQEASDDAGLPSGASAGDGRTDEQEQEQEQDQEQEQKQDQDQDQEEPKDDDPVQTEVLAIAKSVARAEAVKPLEGPTIDLYSTAPDKVKARKALEDSYRTAAGPEGELSLKFSKANAKFERAAKDMEEQLSAWIKKNLDDHKSELWLFLQRRAQVGMRLAKRAGEREAARAASQQKAKRLADNFAAWSSPVAKIGALIGEYAGAIDKLNADINNENNRDQAIFNFWFDIAPKHLQLRREPLTDPIKGQVAALKAALAEHKDVAERLDPGKDRDDGRLFFVEKDGLAGQRTKVLDLWRVAAEAGGDAEAVFKHRPDDAAALKPRWEKLKGDAWVKDAAELLDDPDAKV